MYKSIGSMLELKRFDTITIVNSDVAELDVSSAIDPRMFEEIEVPIDLAAEHRDNTKPVSQSGIPLFGVESFTAFFVDKLILNGFRKCIV